MCVVFVCVFLCLVFVFDKFCDVSLFVVFVSSLHGFGSAPQAALKAHETLRDIRISACLRHTFCVASFSGRLLKEN